MFRQEEISITEITIPKAFLHNPYPKQQSPLEAVFNNDKPETRPTQQWLSNTIEYITSQQIVHYLIMVEGNETLSDSETKMLEGLRTYIKDHFNSLKKTTADTPGSNAQAAAAAAACATPAAADDEVILAVSPPAAPSAPSNSDSCDDSTILASSDVTPAPAADQAITNPVLDAIKNILNLQAWPQQGAHLFMRSDPSGIKQMKQLVNPTLAHFADIAKSQLTQSRFSRESMTIRFYTMLTELNELTELGSQLIQLKVYALNELIANQQTPSVWSLSSKVTLSENDLTILHKIAGINRSDENDLNVALMSAMTAANTAAVATAITAAAASALQTGPRP